NEPAAMGGIVWSSPTHVGAFEVRVTVDPNAVAPDPDRSNNARTIVAGWVTNAVQGVVLTEP
ncbi:MAG TPA: hypothetical protein VM582_01275, partial [Candidatus Thermoplasmatota archaeon]|nr:hypothetical protein [Candidatus Thermoplasmatota archaeon]